MNHCMLNVRAGAGLLGLALAACAPAKAPPPAAPAVAGIASVDGGTAVPAPPAKAPVPVEIPLTLVNVVKQVAPHAKRAAVYGRRESAVDLERSGIPADYLGAATKRRGCVPEVDARYDLIVTDGAELEDAFPLILPVLCPKNREDPDVLLIARGTSTSRGIASDDTKGHLFFDAECTQSCDVYRIESRFAKRWFTTNGLPLIGYGPRFGWSHDPPGRRWAAGAIVDHSVFLASQLPEGLTRVDVEGAPLASGPLVDRDVLVGWLPQDELRGVPQHVQGLGRVSGVARLEGAIGLGRVWSDWTRPSDAPALFADFERPGTFVTMTSAHVDFVLDGATLKDLNARDDAAWREASALVRRRAPHPESALRPIYDELKARDNDLGGRLETLSRAIDCLQRDRRQLPIELNARASFLTEPQQELFRAVMSTL